VLTTGRVKQALHIPEELRLFMRDVASKLDFGDQHELVGPEAIQGECARGGRVEGTDVYRFMYLAADGHQRWELEVRERQIHDIASGALFELDATPLESNTRTQRGEPLLVWGEYDDDALRIRTLGDLAAALDVLAGMGSVFPCAIRLWSIGDDQLICALNGPWAALYVLVSHNHGYGTSVGDPTRSESFELVDHDAGALTVAWADCVPWHVARPALLKFAEHGVLGDGVILDGRIPSQLLMLGDYDRAAELETRRPPPVDPARSSLPEKSPHGAWAHRLLRSLVELQLIEIDTSIETAIIARIAILLAQAGLDVLDSSDAAQQLAKNIERVRGVGALFATGGDLQIALRRSQDPPTQPVELPS
jgi:hypothetical protein